VARGVDGIPDGSFHLRTVRGDSPFVELAQTKSTWSARAARSSARMQAPILEIENIQKTRWTRASEGDPRNRRLETLRNVARPVSWRMMAGADL